MAGRTALVTGASGGLGRHFAMLLAREGAAVVIAARRADRLEAVAREIRDFGGTVSTLVMDVADDASVDRALVQAPCFDIVVNNAGGGFVQPALEHSVRDWNAMIGSNVNGTWFVSRATAARMVTEKRGGSIINLGSVLGLRVMNRTTAYATSKAAVVQMTKQLGLEWARYGIRVNALCPGYFPTESETWDDPAVLEAMTKRVPMRRLGSLEELDAPLLLLASDAGSFITGTTLTVDGGHSNAGV